MTGASDKARLLTYAFGLSAIVIASWLFVGEASANSGAMSRWLPFELPSLVERGGAETTSAKTNDVAAIGQSETIEVAEAAAHAGPPARSGTAHQARDRSPHITLLAINDVYRIGGVERGKRGGLARVRSLRRQLEAEDPDLLLLHAGDAIYPSLLSRTYDGEQMIDVLNGLDGNPHAFDDRFFAVFGNHEFDKRRLEQAGILADRVAESQFTWLRSNITFGLDASGQPLVSGGNLRDTAMIVAGGIKVGLFGLTADIARPAYVSGIEEPLAAAKRLSRELRARGAEVVIALTHLTLGEDMAILNSLKSEGPDLIIGGHEHARQAEKVAGRWVLKADADATSALIVRVTPLQGLPPVVKFAHAELRGDRPAPDPEVDRDVRAWRTRHNVRFCAEMWFREGRIPTDVQRFEDCLDEIVGTTAVRLVAEEERIRSCETNFGNWIADRAREVFPEADIAFVNAGGLRLNQDLPPGKILRRDIEELFQYGGDLALVEIDGKTLQKVADNAVSGWPGNGRWLQVSGFGFRNDQAAAEGPKATDLVLLDPAGAPKPIEAERRLKAVTVTYLLDPGAGDRDGYTMLPTIDNARLADVTLKEVVLGTLAAAPEQAIAPEVEERIRSDAAVCGAPPG